MQTNSLNVSIRSINPGDISPLLDFLNTCEFENPQKRTLVDIYEKNIHALTTQIDIVIKSRNDFLLIAHIDNKIIGVLDFYDSTEEENDSMPMAELGITVLKDYRNQGIGTQMMLKAIDKARSETDIKQIMLSVDSKNASAIHIYEKLGFIVSKTFEKDPKTTFEMTMNFH